MDCVLLRPLFGVFMLCAECLGLWVCLINTVYVVCRLSWFVGVFVEVCVCVGVFLLCAECLGSTVC